MQPRRKTARPDDQVTEAGIESFPASDPPAYNMAGPEAAHDEPAPAKADAEAESAEAGERIIGLAVALGGVFLVALVLWILFF